MPDSGPEQLRCHRPAPAMRGQVPISSAAASKSQAGWLNSNCMVRSINESLLTVAIACETAVLVTLAACELACESALAVEVTLEPVAQDELDMDLSDRPIWGKRAHHLRTGLVVAEMEMEEVKAEWSRLVWSRSQAVGLRRCCWWSSCSRWSWPRQYSQPVRCRFSGLGLSAGMERHSCIAACRNRAFHPLVSSKATAYRSRTGRTAARSCGLRNCTAEQ